MEIGRDSALSDFIRKALPPTLRPSARDFVFGLSSLVKSGNWDSFNTVAIETTTSCNRTCSYCPVSNHRNAHSKESASITDETFLNILIQLSNLDFSGKLALQGYGEPLLDPNLKQRITLSRKYLPNAYITINSNGDFLTEKKLQELLDCGLCHIYITNHSKQKSIPKHLQAILEKPALKNYVSYYQELKKLQNRGGSIDISDFEKENRTAGKKDSEKCITSARTLNIRADGEIIFCDNDYEKNFAVGNVNQNSIEEIWFSQKYVKIREQIRKQTFTQELCQKCNIGKNK